MCNEPDKAWRRKSFADCPLRGPVRPKGVRDTMVSSRFTSWTSAKRRPLASNCSAGELLTTMSLAASNSSTRSWPAEWSRSATTLRCPAARKRNRTPSGSPSRPSDPVRDQRLQRMARGRLHLQNFGASVGQQLRAVRPGQIIGEVEHPHSQQASSADPRSLA